MVPFHVKSNENNIFSPRSVQKFVVTFIPFLFSLRRAKHGLARRMERTMNFSLIVDI
jgi:hypothetical protein